MYTERNSTVEKKMVSLRRVAKVNAGSKRLRFSVMVVCGNKAGSVGIALGRDVDTKKAIEKAAKKAEKTMKKIQLAGDTIPHEVEAKYKAARIVLRPARPGTGVIAGACARSVLELAGIDNVYAKQLGSNDIIANTYCTYNALLMLRNERVLQKMNKMRERIGLKEQMDSEKKAKAKKKFLEKKKEMRKKDGVNRDRRKPNKMIKVKPNVSRESKEKK